MSKEKWTVKKVLKEIFSTVIIFFLISTVLNYIRKPDITENIYAYDLLDIKEDKVHFSEYKGEPLVVHFWATWCPTCKMEASNIEAVSEEYHVISIAVKSGSNKNLNAYMKNQNLSYRVINDMQGRLASKFNIEAYPTTLIYNSKGKLSFSEVGYCTTLGLKARLKLLK